MLFAAFTSIFWAVQSYAEKRTVSTGVSRRDFFFYSCLFLIPFAAIMLFLTPFYFTGSYVLALILLASILLRYGSRKMTGFLVRYFQTMAAFMLTLDFSLPLCLVLSAFILLPILLSGCFYIAENGFLSIIRSVCRIE